MLLKRIGIDLIEYIYYLISVQLINLFCVRLIHTHKFHENVQNKFQITTFNYFFYKTTEIIHETLNYRDSCTISDQSCPFSSAFWDV